MTNSACPTEPAKGPSGNPAPRKSGRPLRTGPRRASLPAGAPATASGAPAVLVFGGDGLLVRSPAATDSAGRPAPEDTATSIPDDAGTPLPAPPAPSAPAGTAPRGGPGTRPVPGPEAGSGPLTRRARRLAEDDSPAAAVVPGIAVESRSAALEPSASPPVPRRRGRVRARLRGLLFLLLIGAIVLVLGTVVPATDADAGASATEVNREAARARTAVLLAQARTARDAEKDPAARALLAQGSGDLAVQLAALGGAGDEAAAGEAATAPVTKGITTAGFAQALGGSAATLLADALTADAALGRTFAAAGTNRLLLASALDNRLGRAAPASTYLPAAVQPVPAAPATCKSTREPQGGANVDTALSAASRAEQKAVYAYQVAGSRLAEPGLSRAVELAAVHENNLELLNDGLARRCLPTVAAVPGFALSRDFTEAPAAALAKLEGELALVYGDLAALSAPASALPAAVPATNAAASNAAPKPAAKPAAAAARVTELRELAVAGMVESASLQREWGGGLDVLPGIASAAQTAAPTVPSSAPPG
ncbi:DUF4439 domain-containing protein [Arthrobacter sp.]|uniref:DUF4439 domain-containing protein n=1 Tax=Arthrobacter sp. TaxID=1667 RepID=UPI0025889CB6|nr:DUF4439 domain-containing protein [Arthrobacter sp.]